MYVVRSCTIPITDEQQVFLVATHKISQSRIPLIHEVIPIFDVLTGALDEFIDNIALPNVVRAAALRGLTMMNKYYELTDDSIVFRIAMSTNHNISGSQCVTDYL